jgi:hypothetical protein
MKREILVCDRCKTEAESKEEKAKLRLGTVALGFDLSYGGFGSGGNVYAAHQTWSRQWCQECRKELGILENQIKKPEPDASPPPTLEEMVREMVKDEMSQ